MLSAVIVLVYALAVARVTRLINEDRITERPRRALAVRLWARYITDEQVAQRYTRMAETGKHGVAKRWMAAERLDAGAEPKPLSVYMLTCPWCVSIYVAAVVAPVAYWWGGEPWAFVPALALSFSYVTGLLAKIGG